MRFGELVAAAASRPALSLHVAERQPTSAISEHSLLYGYRRAGERRRGRPRRADCVCGGDPIVVLAGDEVAGVAAHNATPQHGAWRASQEVG